MCSVQWSYNLADQTKILKSYEGPPGHPAGTTDINWTWATCLPSTALFLPLIYPDSPRAVHWLLEPGATRFLSWNGLPGNGAPGTATSMDSLGIAITASAWDTLKRLNQKDSCSPLIPTSVSATWRTEEQAKARGMRCFQGLTEPGWSLPCCGPGPPGASWKTEDLDSTVLGPSPGLSRDS